MSVNDKLTSLADKYRSAFNTADKFSIDSMISSMTGLEACNYVEGITPDNYVKWKDGVGSYSTDASTKVFIDISRIRFKDLEKGHNYSLQVSMKDQGTFNVYVWPTNAASSQSHCTVALTDDWKTYEVKFNHIDDTKPGGFIRVNSDHQAMNSQIKDIKLYKR